MTQPFIFILIIRAKLDMISHFYFYGFSPIIYCTQNKINIHKHISYNHIQ